MKSRHHFLRHTVEGTGRITESDVDARMPAQRQFCFDVVIEAFGFPHMLLAPIRPYVSPGILGGNAQVLYRFSSVQ